MHPLWLALMVHALATNKVFAQDEKVEKIEEGREGDSVDQLCEGRLCKPAAMKPYKEYYCPRDVTKQSLNTMMGYWCLGRVPMEYCPDHCQRNGCNCMRDKGVDVTVAKYKRKKYKGSDILKEVILPSRECMTWPQAQAYCCKKYGGKLWEPKDTSELQSVWEQMKSTVGSFSSTCRLWIGANNWNPPNGNVAHLTSSGDVAPFTTDDGYDGGYQNCVTISGDMKFDDFSGYCSRYRFLCQVEKKIIDPCWDQDLTAKEINPRDLCKCEAEYKPPECPSCEYKNCECVREREEKPVATYDRKKIIFVPQCLNWIEAQRYCCDKYHGILWEPTSAEEVDTVYKTEWFKDNFSGTSCFAWMGLNNWSPSTVGYLASSSGTIPAPDPISISDGSDRRRHNCVALRGDNRWWDWNCECARLPFFCQTDFYTRG